MENADGSKKGKKRLSMAAAALAMLLLILSVLLTSFQVVIYGEIGRASCRERV